MVATSLEMPTFRAPTCAAIMPRTDAKERPAHHLRHSISISSHGNPRIILRKISHSVVTQLANNTDLDPGLNVLQGGGEDQRLTDLVH